MSNKLQDGRRPNDLDSLRLLGLGRIPRCAACPRFRALLQIHRSAGQVVAPPPAPPEDCTYRVCAPLSLRCWGPLFEAGVAQPVRFQSAVAFRNWDSAVVSHHSSSGTRQGNRAG